MAIAVVWDDLLWRGRVERAREVLERLTALSDLRCDACTEYSTNAGLGAYNHGTQYRALEHARVHWSFPLRPLVDTQAAAVEPHGLDTRISIAVSRIGGPPKAMR